jgi:hypothetical protein
LPTWQQISLAGCAALAQFTGRNMSAVATCGDEKSQHLRGQRKELRGLERASSVWV